MQCTDENHSGQKWRILQRTTKIIGIYFLDLPSFTTFWSKRTICARIKSCESLFCSDRVSLNVWHPFGIISLLYDAFLVTQPSMTEIITTIPYTDREYSTYCTRWKTYAHTLICLWHKKIINFGNAPTLFMTFARATRKNHQNLSKLLCGNTSNSRREHTHRHKNVQYTDSQSLSWHCWLG